MAIHLLLEEKVGPLTDKQVELLVAAREDSDRLHGILNNLLDISRIESGKAQIEFGSVSPHSIVAEVVESFRRAAQDQGVTLRVDLPTFVLRLPVKRTAPAGAARVSVTARAADGRSAAGSGAVLVR